MMFDNKKHILNVVFSAEKKHHGILNIHHNISEALLANDYRVTNLFLTGDPAGLPAFPGNNEYWKLDTHLVRKKGVFNKLKHQLPRYRLLQFVKKNSIDMAICDGISSIALLCSIQAFAPIKAMGIFHGLTRLTSQRRKLIKKQISLWQFVSVSEIIRDKLLASNCGIIAQNSCVIHNSVDVYSLKESAFAKYEARERLGISQKKFVFGITGRLVACKNHAVIIDAVHLLKMNKQWPEDVQVVIIGDGDKEEFLKEKVINARLQEDFLFTGWVNNAGYYVSAFDTFIMASTDEEGFGVALLEGCVAKIPVITSDIEIFRKITGNNACYFPVGDSEALSRQMLRIISSSEAQRMEKGQMVYNHIRQYFDIKAFKLSYLVLSGKMLE